MTDRTKFDTNQRGRLRRAGYVCVERVWLPEAFARRVEQQADMHREDVERIANTPLRQGRPRKAAE